MAAYLIVNYDIVDPDVDGEYVAMSSGPVLKFASKNRAREIYQSADYQAVIGKRFDATTNHFAVLVDGLS